MQKIKGVFENSPSGLHAVIVMGAILLTVLAGLFMVIGALLGTFVFGISAKAASPSSALLLLAIVLLVLILFLLLVLLKCSGCLGKKERFPVQLLGLLPILPWIPVLFERLIPALQAVSTALNSTSSSLNVVHTNLTNAGAAISIPTDITTALNAMGISLSPITDVLEALDTDLNDFGSVVTELNNAATLLNDIAIALPSSE